MRGVSMSGNKAPMREQTIQVTRDKHGTSRFLHDKICVFCIWAA